MENTDDTAQRLTDLEIKAAFNEDLLDQLNEIIVRQQQQIDLIMCEIVRLRQSGVDADLGSSGNPLEELPPHY